MIYISSRYFLFFFVFFYQLQTLKTTPHHHFFPYVKNPLLLKTLFKLGAFLNFQEWFPNSIEPNPESHSIWLCRRLQGVFMRDIEQWFLWHGSERGGGGRNVMKALGPPEKGYSGLGNCGLFACVCFREINRSLKSWESKTEKYWYKEWQILRNRKRNLTCVEGVFRVRVHMWYLTLSNSLDSFLFSSVSRTLSLSYFCLYSVSNSSRSLWLQRRDRAQDCETFDTV